MTAASVAVKIQYPGVAEAIRADMQNAGLIMRMAKALAPGLDAKAAAEELKERVMEELDYELEAQSQRAFAAGTGGTRSSTCPSGHPAVHRAGPRERVGGRRGFDEVRGGPRRSATGSARSCSASASGASTTSSTSTPTPTPATTS